jgi:hypothetical protein
MARSRLGGFSRVAPGMSARSLAISGTATGKREPGCIVHPCGRDVESELDRYIRELMAKPARRYTPAYGMRVA